MDTVIILGVFLLAHIVTTICIGVYLNRAAKREVLNAANNVLNGLQSFFPMMFTQQPANNGSERKEPVSG